MANRTSASGVVAALCLLVLVVTGAEARHHPRLVPAVFVFGDSTVDVGNNYYRSIAAAARANYPHYGVDFPGSVPTGRFSNGFNTADLLAIGLGFRASPPAYHSLTAKTIRSQMYKGINFASGGSGLSDGTGRLLFGEMIPMSWQLEYFSLVVRHMTKQSGANNTASLLSKSIFLISAGSNDMFEYSASPGDDYEFLSGLVATYKRYITALYEMGARKFSVISIPPLGCLPSQRLRRLQQLGTQGCYDPLNVLSLRSYPMLAAMLEDLARELPGMAYSLADAFAMVSFVLENPRTDAWEFTELEAACCGGGPYGAAYACNETAPLCADRDGHLFWDANHPTQAVSFIAARTILVGSGTFVKPVNLRELGVEYDPNYNVSSVGTPVGPTVQVMCLADLFPYLTAVSFVHPIYTSCKPHGKRR